MLIKSEQNPTTVSSLNSPTMITALRAFFVTYKLLVTSMLFPIFGGIVPRSLNIEEMMVDTHIRVRRNRSFFFFVLAFCLSVCAVAPRCLSISAAFFSSMQSPFYLDSIKSIIDRMIGMDE